ncbi:succinyl-diaminopimelate desuccinylase [Anaeroplasma bactoclasticum]|jgi:succinyl-diaminopimelate desuccinylase|uniref:Succinyl-diaminopimelate desuccinylase n=1 Tax=Anaeroplasma bactoclasticum TaxID=2088 RepID=A0A397RWY1_9MOLU|nr:dipeptidase PepV [Anaeroplasma bactoclasticum]RIA77752.1 succinyl-diaminopimelate desuccinylase [Anaeroplasma bactoclasticum]
MDFSELYKKERPYAIEVLKKLISYKSVLDEYKENSDAPFGIENKKALEYILSVGKSDGFITKNIDNYAGHIEYGEGNEILGVLAHLDVVPVNESEWDSNPFELRFDGGKMFARGSLDDKGPLVASYIALKMLKDMGFKPKRRIRLIMGCDEESGSRCLERYLEKEEKPTLGFSPDACFPLIYGEKAMTSYDIYGDSSDDIILTFTAGDRYNVVPSEAKMTLKSDYSKEFEKFLKDKNYNGKYQNGEYIAYGVAAHAMNPEIGVNAAYILFEFLHEYTDSKIAKFMDEYFLGDTWGKKLGYDMYDEEMKYLTSNFAVVRIEDGKLKFGVNCRVPLDSQFKVIEEKVANATKKYGYSYKILYNSPRHYVSPKSELVTKLMDVYKEVTKDTTNGPITIGGGTYAREIGQAVAFGPLVVGREDVCHIANEYLYESDFDLAVEVYFKAIYELTK